MIEAMIVPTLHAEGLEKRLHNSSPCCRRVSMLWRFDESDVTGAWIGGTGGCLRRTGSDQTAAARATGVPGRAARGPPAVAKGPSGDRADGALARRAPRP